MQFSSAPDKIVLPFANSGARNVIPVASQIGILPGAASLTDGFPPLTRTPEASGGLGPSGLDMNGILFSVSAISRWALAGGGYVFDTAFASDSNIGGYPKGARLLRSDGAGYWFNTVDNNTTDPESSGSASAGWVPDFSSGVTAVTMTNSNVTLTAEQYGKPVIVITGLLTSNLSLIFPALTGKWTVINNTTGMYTITCRTASGTGVSANSVQLIVGDGTNLDSSAGDAISLLGKNVASAAGTSDAITAAFIPAPHIWPAGVPFFVRAASANATTAPTITFNSGTLPAKTIIKGNNLPLLAGDIAGPGHWLTLLYDSTLDAVVLVNPANGVIPGAQHAGEICYFARNTAPTGFLKANGAAVSRTTYAALFSALVRSATVTMTIASPGVVTWAAHGLAGSDPIKFTTTGALPTGFTAGTTYYVVGASLTSDTFQLSETAGGTAINTSGSQSGVHTAINAPWGTGDGSTTFNVPDLRGEFLRGWDDSRSVDSSRSFGSAQASQNLAHTHSSATGNSFWVDAPGLYGVNSGGTPININAGAATTSSGGAEARPRNVALLACVKY